MLFKNAFFFALFMLWHHISFSQEAYQIKGNLIDTVEGVYLDYTSLVLINRTDSAISAHTRSDMQGEFAFKSVPKGD